MRHVLTIHPGGRCDAISGLTVDVERPAPGRLLLRYRLLGVTDALVMPARSDERLDELWMHTCLEAFVQAPPDEAYREFNLSPGGAWAAYRFDRYRTGMAEADIGRPEFEVADAGPGILDIGSAWELDLPMDRLWRVGVTAMIEDAGHGLSYWAVARPPGKPDFHNAEGFILELPTP